MFEYESDYVVPRRHSTLGATPVDQGVQAAAVAANLIPGVGPIISGVLEVGDAIFGGGDPTALSVYINNMVGLRNQLAQLNRSMGYADTFVVPSGFNAQDKTTWANFVESIAVQFSGKPLKDVQSSNRRKDYELAISNLKTAVQQASTQAQVEQQVAAATGHAPAAPYPTPAAATVTSPSVLPVLQTAPQAGLYQTLSSLDTTLPTSIATTPTQTSVSSLTDPTNNQYQYAYPISYPNPYPTPYPTAYPYTQPPDVTLPVDASSTLPTTSPVPATTTWEPALLIGGAFAVVALFIYMSKGK